MGEGVVACNGVGTPRLLLNSRSNVRNETLANRSTLVGKNLMLHPLGFVEGYFKKNLNSSIGPHGCCVLSQEFYETSSKREFKRGFTMQILRGPGPIEFSKSAVQRRLIPIGNGHHEAFKKKFNKNIGISIICEDLPNEQNSVVLHDTLKDSNGIPCPKINYKLCDNTKKMMAFGIERAKEVMEASGAEEIYSFEVLYKHKSRSLNAEISFFYNSLIGAIEKRPYNLNGNDSIIYDGEWMMTIANTNIKHATLRGVNMMVNHRVTKNIEIS